MSRSSREVFEAIKRANDAKVCPSCRKPLQRNPAYKPERKGKDRDRNPLPEFICLTSDCRRGREGPRYRFGPARVRRIRKTGPPTTGPSEKAIARMLREMEK